MKDEHINNLLDENRFEDLSETELRQIEAHIGGCADCGYQYEAAKIASLILRERVTQTIEPTPFFEARVLRAWREKQATLEPVTSRLRQLWQDTKILVSGLATAVALLMVLTLFIPQNTAVTPLQALIIDDYSVESIVFDRQDAPDDLTDTQLLDEIYGDDDLEN
jgi:hypothetical protein